MKTLVFQGEGLIVLSDRIVPAVEAVFMQQFEVREEQPEDSSLVHIYGTSLISMHLAVKFIAARLNE